MNCRLAVLLMLFVTCVSSNAKGTHRGTNNASTRQQILRQSQNENMPNQPMLSLNEIKTENDQHNPGASETALTPINADSVNGITSLNSGMGLPFGTRARSIDKNPLIGASGLTKNSLADIMYGNLKELVSDGRVRGEAGNEFASFNAMQQGNEQGNLGQNMMFGGSLGDSNNNLVNAIGTGLGNGVSINNLAAMNGLIASGPGLNSFSVNPGSMNSPGGGLAALGLSGFNPNALGAQGAGINGFGGPPLETPNPGIGLQLLQRLNSMQAHQNNEQEVPEHKHHKRNHRHHKRHHHRKSTTKVLLSLLVDKLKDIYELDQMTAAKNGKLQSATSGKIAETLDALDLPKNDVDSRDTKPTPNNTLSEFKTKLSFPVTVTDSNASKIVLTGKDDRKSKKEDKDDDDANIQSILSNLGIKEGSGSEDAPKKKSNEIDDIAADFLEKLELPSASQAIVGPKADALPMLLELRGREVKNENAKTHDIVERVPESARKVITENAKTHDTVEKVSDNAETLDTVEKVPKSLLEDDLKSEDAGSLSEFHKIKANIDLDSKAIDFLSSSLPGTSPGDMSPSSKLEILGNSDLPRVSALHTFSISSLLNEGDDDSSPFDKEGSNYLKQKKQPDILNLVDNDKSKAENSTSEVISHLPSDLGEYKSDVEGRTGSSSKETNLKSKDSANYLQAARVLGAVYKKVRDPVARSSVETAIKAMLKVMRYESSSQSSFSKKQDVPGDKVLQKELHKELSQLTKTVDIMRKSLLLKNSRIIGTGKQDQERAGKMTGRNAGVRKTTLPKHKEGNQRDIGKQDKN